MSDPNPKWGARFRKDSHVRELKQSFLGHGTISKHIGLAVVDDQAYEDFLLAQSNPTPGNLAKMDYGRLAITGRGMEAYAGDHSRMATSEAKTEFPSTKLYREVDGCHLLVAPDTPETHRQLRRLGNNDNITQGVQLKLDFATIVTQMHHHILALKARFVGATVPSEQYRKLKADLVALDVCTAAQSQQISVWPFWKAKCGI